jgi:hypothetical protein
MSSCEGVGNPLPPITSKGTVGSGSPWAIDGTIMEGNDNSPVPVPANSAKPNHRKLELVIADPPKTMQLNGRESSLDLGWRRGLCASEPIQDRMVAIYSNW